MPLVEKWVIKFAIYRMGKSKYTVVCIENNTIINNTRINSVRYSSAELYTW